MEFSGSGLTAWYGTPDTPAPPQNGTVAAPAEVTIGVSPAMASNSVTILYRENAGVQFEVRATVRRTDTAAKKQYFRALLPPFSPGVRVEYQPVVYSAGRQLTTRTPFPSSFCISDENAGVSSPGPDPLRVGTQLYKYRMDQIGRVAVQLAKLPEVIGDTPDGLRLDFLIASGLFEGQSINGIFRASGGDWMRVRTDGIGVVDIIATIQTNDGVLILMEASGKFDLGIDGFQRALSGSFPTTGPVVVYPSFLTSDSRYLWLNRLPCVGIGYVNMDSLHVHYDVYAIYSESDTTDGE